MQLYLMNYGLLAVFLLAMVDADVVPVVTGVVAQLGYFNPVLAIAVASGGAFAGDCICYLLGRRQAHKIRDSRFFIRAGQKVERLSRHLGLWQIPVSHLIYGTRIATMTVCGVRRVPFTSFALVDLAGCLSVTTLLAMLGYMFSANAEAIVLGIRRIEFWVFALLLLVSISFFALRALCAKSTCAARLATSTPKRDNQSQKA
jgi:membrane protein DedA with SNARE-associated domain